MQTFAVVASAGLIGSGAESTVIDGSSSGSVLTLNGVTNVEITGFSITNGGVFGSLLSTPILNPPQSSILGMHKIQQRPMAENGEVVIRPMMYVALSYDHRIVDGKGAVTFLKRVKEYMENPERILLEV